MAFEDVPEGHAAWDLTKNVKLRPKTDNFVITYKSEEGWSCNFQTLTRSKSHVISEEHAKRILRLCVAKFMEGKSKEDVTAFRNELYTLAPQLASPSAGKREAAPNDKPKERKRPKTLRDKTTGADDIPEPSAPQTLEDAREKAKDQLREIMERLRREGRLEDAFCIKGRVTGKKTTSINGIYAPIQGGFDGHPAFERCSHGPELVVFWKSEKKRWCLSVSLGNRSHIAFLPVDVLGKFPISSGDAVWRVYDGKGFNAEADLCSAPIVHATTASQPQPTSESSKSDSDSDDSSAETEQKKMIDVKPKLEVAGSPPTVWRGRTATKMLVRAGLRCSCHYQLDKCPFESG